MKSLLTAYFRNAFKQIPVTLVSFIGLSLGIISFVFILKYVWFESSFESFIPNVENVYRINYSTQRNGELSYDGVKTPNQLEYAINYGTKIPGIASCTKLYFDNQGYAWYGDNLLSRQKIMWAEEGFEKVFQLELVAGKAFFNEPAKGIICQSKAKLFFKNDNPLGKIIKVNDSTDVEITGVYKDFPANTHLSGDFIVSVCTWRKFNWYSREGRWRNPNFMTYVRLEKNIDAKSVELSLNKQIVIGNDFFKNNDLQPNFTLQPIANSHYVSGKSGEYGTTVPHKTMRFLVAIAFFILIITLINYIDLKMSDSIKRQKSFHIQHTLGASHWTLIKQNFFESLIFMTTGIIVSLVIYLLSEKYIFSMFSIRAKIGLEDTITFYAKILPFLAFVLIATSFVVAAFASKLSLSLESFKKRVGNSKQYFVVIQLFISMMLLISTIVVFKQIRFMQQVELGANYSKLLVFDIPSTSSNNVVNANLYLSFRTELLKHPEIENIGAVMRCPGDDLFQYAQNFTNPENLASKNHSFGLNYVDNGFFNVYKIGFVAGQNFRPGVAFQQGKIVINQLACNYLGYTSPDLAIGKTIQGQNNQSFEIIGVVNDFHSKGLHSNIEPLIFFCTHPFEFGYYAIRPNTHDMAQAISVVKEVWAKYYDESLFTYFFQDQYFNTQYRSDTQLSKLFSTGCIIAIIISCLGLYSLVLFSTERNKKSIGLRKVNGATVVDVLILLNRAYLYSVLIAFAIATPIACFYMQKWLQNFAYRTELSWWVFALAGTATLIIALITISWQSFKAATRNPVEALRSE